MAISKEPLRVTHPQLAAQADGWDTSTLSAGSSKKVGWKCERGHTWQDSVSHRSAGRGCPVCSNHQVLVGYNDLATTHSAIASQAFDWDPTTLIAGSSKKVGWKCEQGHIWSATVNDRSAGRGCPVCSNHQVLVGYNDLATTHSAIASQAFDWDPTTLTAGSSMKVGWCCEYGHSWTSTVNNRVRGGSCPVCLNRKVLIGFNDLATTHPSIAAQAFDWNPTTLAAGSTKKVSWRCSYGHIWEAAPSSRVLGADCLICCNQQVLAGFNDLATTHPDIAAEAFDCDPTTVTAGSNKKFSWRCSQGHIWVAVVKTRKKTGCAVCNGKQINVGFNDLATTHPDIAVEAYEWDPVTVTAGSAKKMQWKCAAGHRWMATVTNRTKERGTGCPICTNKVALPGFNDLATTHPSIAAEAVDWDPTTVITKSTSKKTWLCPLGHRYVSSPQLRVNGHGCPFCSGRKVLSGFNDLATTHPELAREADGWDPTTAVTQSHQKFNWICIHGHKWKATCNSRVNMSAGCPSCAPSGFSPNQEGWLYLLEHDDLDMYQIGISNAVEKRITQHKKRGWAVIEVRGPMEGHLARQLETAILRVIEKRGAERGHKADIEKFDGYSEAWLKDSLSVAGFKQLLDWVYEDDEALILLDLSDKDVL